MKLKKRDVKKKNLRQRSESQSIFFLLVSEQFNSFVHTVVGFFFILTLFLKLLLYI